MSDIHIILTGGTIEKTYDPLTEKPEFQQSSILPDYLQNIIKSYPDLIFEVISQIDSMEMNEIIRSDIAQAVDCSLARSVIIVHGTSTMEGTAQYLAQNLKNMDKTIVLTGAMIPLKEFAMSDGGFNLGYAMAQAQNAAAGIYVSMNARLFDALDVTKDTRIGRFSHT